MIARETLEKAIEDIVVENLGDILHGHKVRLKLLDQSPKGQDEWPLGIVSVPTAAPAVGGKWLAWRAASKQLEALGRREEARDLGGLNCFDVSCEKHRIVVLLVRISAANINVDARNHLNASES